ncbi:MAG: hypothetical protein AB8D78_05085 [Akkermansiaceae bacterium]
MHKSVFLTVAFGVFALLVSCEPLPSYPPPGYQPSTGMYGPQGRMNPYAPRSVPQPQNSRYGAPVNPNTANNPYGLQEPRTQPSPTNPAPAPSPKPSYPSAERTDNPNQVISPYKPYNVIDVEGFKPGQLAKDPSNGKIFRVP